MLKPLLDFVALDLETTGLDSETAGIIEVGAVRFRNGKAEEAFQKLLRHEGELSPLVTHLTGLSTASLAEAEEPAPALKAFRDFAGDLPLVAHNAEFDLAFLAHALEKAGLPPLEAPVLDTLLLARLAWPVWPNHRLETLVDRLGLHPERAHRALPDAEMAAQVFLLAQEELRSYSPRTLANLVQVLRSAAASEGEEGPDEAETALLEEPAEAGTGKAEGESMAIAESASGRAVASAALEAPVAETPPAETPAPAPGSAEGPGAPPLPVSVAPSLTPSRRAAAYLLLFADGEVEAPAPVEKTFPPIKALGISPVTLQKVTNENLDLYLGRKNEGAEGTEGGRKADENPRTEEGGTAEGQPKAEGGRKAAMAAGLPAFRPRKGQHYLAQLVALAQGEGQNLVAETQPGVGKSLGYLLPSALYALRNNRRIAICAGTRAGQRLLAEEEGEILKKALAPEFGEAFRITALKGPSSYLDPDRYALALRETATLLTAEEALSFLPVITWHERTETGDIEENAGFNADKQRFLWLKLAARNYAAAAGKPSFAARAKARAQGSHLVIITHGLFLEDLALDFSLLPSFEHVVFDEAHLLPEEAAEKLGRQLGYFRLKEVLHRLQSAKKGGRGLLRLAAEGSAPAPASDPAPAANGASAPAIDAAAPEKAFQKFMSKLGKQAKKRRRESESKLRYADKPVVEFNVSPEAFIASLSECAEGCRRLASAVKGEKEGLARELEAVAQDLDGLSADAEHLFNPSPEKEVYWLEDFLNPHRGLIRSAPADFGQILKDKLYPVFASASFLSSAIAVGDGLQYFQKRIGLEGREKLLSRLVRGGEGRPPRVFVTRMVPTLQNAASTQGAAEVVGRCLARLPHPALVLYTSVNALRHSKAVIQKALLGAGRLVLAQHVEGGRENVLNLFRHETDACLLGTESLLGGSFAEEGRKVAVVALTKLPFPVPSDPLAARAIEAVQQRGGNPLYEYLVPEAILALKSMLARLPAQEPRFRALWILDPRLLTEKYGKAFSRVWEGRQVQAENEEELIRLTQAHLAGEEVPLTPLPAAGGPSAEAGARGPGSPGRGGRPDGPGGRGGRDGQGGSSGSGSREGGGAPDGRGSREGGERSPGESGGPGRSGSRRRNRRDPNQEYWGRGRGGNRPDGSRPDGNRHGENHPGGNRPDGNRPEGSRPDGHQPEGTRPGTGGEDKNPSEGSGLLASALGLAQEGLAGAAQAVEQGLPVLGQGLQVMKEAAAGLAESLLPEGLLPKDLGSETPDGPSYSRRAAGTEGRMPGVGTQEDRAQEDRKADDRKADDRNIPENP